MGFVIRCLYSTVSLTLVREQSFIRISYYYYYICIIASKVIKILVLGLSHKAIDTVALLLIFHKFLLLQCSAMVGGFGVLCTSFLGGHAY